MIHSSPSQSPKDLFKGLSQTAFASSLQFLKNEILYGDSPIGEAALYVYKLYSKVVSLELFALGIKLKKLNHKEFQDMVDPVAQSVWAYGSTHHAHHFRKPVNGLQP